jgi:hypothetical protein
MGDSEDFIYICTEICELTLYTVSTMLFKTALHITDRFSIKKREAWKIWKTLGGVIKTTAAQLKLIYHVVN